MTSFEIRAVRKTKSPVASPCWRHDAIAEKVTLERREREPTKPARDDTPRKPAECGRRSAGPQRERRENVRYIVTTSCTPSESSRCTVLARCINTMRSMTPCAQFRSS